MAGKGFFCLRMRKRKCRILTKRYFDMPQFNSVTRCTAICTNYSWQQLFFEKKKKILVKKDNESVETDKQETDLTFRGEGVRKIDDVREKLRIPLTRDGNERESEAGRIIMTVQIETIEIKILDRMIRHRISTTQRLVVLVRLYVLTVRLQGARSLLDECRTNPVWLLKPCFTIQALQGWSLAISMRWHGLYLYTYIYLYISCYIYYSYILLINLVIIVINTPTCMRIYVIYI